MRTANKEEDAMAKKKAGSKMKPEEKTDIRLRVDPELHQRIQAAADQEGNSVAAFIRSAVVKELKRREKETNE
jgi:predicted HicB family RNase H-like nuclease